MFAQFDDAARLVLRLAEQEARTLRHARIDTEHLLLALLELHDCVAERVLRRAEIGILNVREEVTKLVLPGLFESDCPRMGLTDGARKAIDLAIAAAQRLGHSQVGTGHLLLGLLEEAE